MNRDRDIEYLRHIKDEIDFLSAQCKDITINDLKNDPVLQRASLRSLEVIGEAVKNLSGRYEQEHPEIEWRKIAGFRDIIIHHYFGIDWNVVWDVIKNKVPDLDKTIRSSIKCKRGE